MDNFQSLHILSLTFRDHPMWDDDLRALYAAKLAEAPPPRPRTLIRLAAALEGLAAWLRRNVHEPAARTA